MNPTGYLRFVITNGADSRVPHMACGIHRYKLQQKLLGDDFSVEWVDIEIDHQQPTVETSANTCKCNYQYAWHCAKGENLKACTCECHTVNRREAL